MLYTPSLIIPLKKSKYYHFSTGHVAFGNLVFIAIIQPHFLHWPVTFKKCSQDLQIFILLSSVTWSTRPISLFNRSQGFADLSSLIFLHVNIMSNYCISWRNNDKIKDSWAIMIVYHFSFFYSIVNFLNRIMCHLL